MARGSGDDLARKPVSFIVGWGAPILLILASGFVALPLWATPVVFAASFAWMSVACAVNAARCRRRHCYLSSPVLMVSAILTLLVGFEIVDFGADGVGYVAWTTLALVLLTFLPEFFLGKYMR